VKARRGGRNLERPAATCRKYYIHPAVIAAYSDGFLFGVMEHGAEQSSAYTGLGLRLEEYSVTVIAADYQKKLARSRQASPFRGMAALSADALVKKKIVRTMPERQR